MKYSVDYMNGVISLPERVVGMLPEMSRVEIAALIYILSPERYGKEITPSELAGALRCDGGAADSALERLVAIGLIKPLKGSSRSVKVREDLTSAEGAKVTLVSSGDTPHYSGEEIKAIFEADPYLHDFISECEHQLERMFSSHEINRLLALREYQGLDAEYIIILCSYMKSINRGTVPAVDQKARALISEGVLTVAALEERIAYLRLYDSAEGTLRKLIGAGGRAFTKTEKKFINNWVEMGYGPDVIEIAYEVAVNNTGKASLPYMNKVLTNWNTSGYRTKEDVFAGLENYQKKKEEQASAADSKKGSFEADEFFEAALKHALKKHNKA